MMGSDFIIRGETVELPTYDLHLGQYCLQTMEMQGDRIAIRTEVDGVEKNHTFSQLVHFGKVVSLILKDYGVKSEGTVMVCCGNVLEFAPVYLGTLFLGAACSTMNPSSCTEDFRHLISIIKPNIILCNKHARPKMLNAVLGSSVRTMIVSLELLYTCVLQSSAECANKFQMVEIADVKEHVALVIPSSGMSGRQKAVEIPQQTLLNVLHGVYKLPPSCVIMTGSGPFWATGCLYTTYCFGYGCELVLLPQFSEQVFMDTIVKYKVNVTMTAPNQIAALSKWPHLEKYQIPYLMYLCVVGNRLNLTLKQLVEERLDTYVTNVFGMTETLGAFELPKRGLVGKPATVGKILVNSMAKIVDVETGKNLGPNCEGELCVKTNFMLKGYRGDPQATKDLFDEDGFMHTGDIACYDADGYFFILDRNKELIKYKNIQVCPVEIEEVLMSNKEVLDAAVVGFRHDEDTERATAFVIRRKGSDVKASDLLELVEQTLPSIKWLHGGLYFVDHFPISGSGKVIKRELRALFTAGKLKIEKH